MNRKTGSRRSTVIGGNRKFQAQNEDLSQKGCQSAKVQMPKGKSGKDQVLEGTDGNDQIRVHSQGEKQENKIK